MSAKLLDPMAAMGLLRTPMPPAPMPPTPRSIRGWILVATILLILPNDRRARAGGGIGESNAARSDTVFISDGNGQPALSSVQVQAAENAVATEVSGIIRLEHAGPEEILAYLDLPIYEQWAAQHRAETGSAPGLNEALAAGVTIPVAGGGAGGLTPLLRFDRVVEVGSPATGRWTLRLYDTVPNGISGLLSHWELTVRYLEDQPPELASWQPETGTVVAGREVDLSCYAIDPDDPTIDYQISVYQQGSLILRADTDQLIWNTLNVGDGVYEVEFVALSGSIDSPGLDLRRSVVEVDNGGPSLRDIAPHSGAVLSGLVPLDIETSGDARTQRGYLQIGLSDENLRSVYLPPGVPWSLLLDTREIADGPQPVFLALIDSLGNLSGDAALREPRAYVIDNAAPIVFFTEAADVAGALSNQGVTFVASDQTSNVTRLEIYLDEKSLGDVAVPEAGKVQRVHLTLPGDISDGRHTLTVVAVDEARNRGTSSLEFVYGPPPESEEAKSLSR
jgi:hypothetical protein